MATIFVEGIADLKFLIDLVKHKFNYSLTKEEIRAVEGKDSLHLYTRQFNESTLQGLTNLLVFDANGSHEGRLRELEVKKEELDIQFIPFLIPNDKDSGNLETLLRNIANYPEVFDCIDPYGDCIEGLSLKRLKGINEKAKMYIYVDSFKDSGYSKEKDRDYLNGIWNLDSEHLTPLYNFLSPYFRK